MCMAEWRYTSSFSEFSKPLFRCQLNVLNEWDYLHFAVSSKGAMYSLVVVTICVICVICVYQWNKEPANSCNYWQTPFSFHYTTCFGIDGPSSWSCNLTLTFSRPPGGKGGYLNFSASCMKYVRFIWTLLTHSTQQSPSWEANRFAASQEIPRILWNPTSVYVRWIVLKIYGIEVAVCFVYDNSSYWSRFVSVTGEYIDHQRCIFRCDVSCLR
jgi:hypothetical protein